MNDGVIRIIVALIGLLGTIITYVAIPYIKTKINKEQREDILFWVKIAVNAAEQMVEAGIITVPKKSYVINFLQEKGIDITEKELDILIEAAVYEMNQWK